MDILKRDFLEKVSTGRKSGRVGSAVRPVQTQRWRQPSLDYGFLVSTVRSLDTGVLKGVNKCC